MSNRPYGTLYIGVTSDITRRVWDEPHEDIRTAIQREKTMKHWSRAWKLDLIAGRNPTWADLTSS
jgi:putative endonuclease